MKTLNEICESTIDFYNSLVDDNSKKMYKSLLIWRMLGHEAFYNEVASYDKNEYYGWNELEEYECLKNDKSTPVILFGSGSNGLEFYYQLKALNYNVTAFCDNDKNKIGKQYLGLPIISPNELVNDYKDAFIIVTVSRGREDIYNQLIGLNIDKSRVCLPLTGFACIYNIDKRQYVDDSVFIPDDNEVFIDAGAFDGQTTIDFAKWVNGKYKRIYCFEPAEAMFKRCCENFKRYNLSNIELIPAGVYSENTTLNFNNQFDTSGAATISTNGTEIIECRTIDSVLNGKEATYIKMDIEGSELEALKGAKNTIINYKPKLAVCIYHKTEDFYVIPEYIKSLRTDYKFYIRKYTPHHGEFVLYAI